MSNSEKVVILCGGRGTRLHEETEFRPKPLVPIGGTLVLVHIMNLYSHYGYKNFVLCLGYKGEMIREYFDKNPNKEWNVILENTGLESQTGTRIKKIEKHITEDKFLATYGDGIANINIKNLMDFHNKQNTIGTLTAVHPHSKYGQLKDGNNGLVTEFVEKPVLYDYINGGFFIFKKEFFNYLTNDENCILEHEPFSKLVQEKQLSMYKHEDFWHCMDTYKDYLDLNKMYDSGKKPWILGE